MVASTMHGRKRTKRSRFRTFDELDCLESRVLLSTVANGGFETGSLSSWTVSGTGSSSVVTGQAHSGTYAAQLGNASANSFIYQNVSVSPNTTYQLTGFAKMTAGTAVLSVQNYGGPQLDENFNSSSTYAQQFNTFTTGSSASIVTIVLFRPAGTGNAYFDDISIDTLASVHNTGFETGNLNAWTTFGSPTVVTGQAHSGTYAVQLPDTNLSEISTVFSGLQPSTTYVLSAWSKSSNPNDSAIMQVYSSSGSGSLQTSFSGSSYSQQSITFTTNSTETSVNVVLIGPIGSYGGSTYFDDINLQQLAPVANFNFEAGSLTGWTTIGTAGVVSSPVHTGSYAAKVSSSSHITETISNLIPGDWYTLSAYVKVDGGGSAEIQAQNFGIGFVSSGAITNGTYQQVSISFQVGSSNTSASFLLFNNAATGNAYFDDLSLVDTSQPV